MYQTSGAKYFIDDKIYHEQNQQFTCRRVFWQEMELMIPPSEPSNAWQGSRSCQAEERCSCNHLMNFTENSGKKTQIPTQEGQFCVDAGGQTKLQSCRVGSIPAQTFSRLESIHTDHLLYSVLTYE